MKCNSGIRVSMRKRRCYHATDCTRPVGDDDGLFVGDFEGDVVGLLEGELVGDAAMQYGNIYESEGVKTRDSE